MWLYRRSRRGYYLLAFVDIASAEAPLIGIAFTALSILPVGMTRLRQPPAPQAASLALRHAWRISPVGVAGMLAVGGLSMTITGFAPIHATAKGYQPAGRGAAAVRLCRSARCSCRFRSAGSPTAPTAATC